MTRASTRIARMRPRWRVVLTASRSVGREPPVSQRRSDRARTGHAGCRRCRGMGDRSVHRSGDQPVRPPGRLDARRAGAQRQHHRRSPGLELVHQSHPRPPGDGRGDRAGTADRQRSGARPVERHLAEARRIRAGLHDPRLARRSLVRVVRRGRAARSRDRRDCGRQQDLLGARLLAGRELPRLDQARRARHRRQGDVHARVRAQARRCATAISMRC